MINDEELKEPNTENINEENPVSESPENVPETKANDETPKDNLDTKIVVDKPKPDETPYNEVIEEERKLILSQEKKSRLRSSISLFVVLGCGIGAIALLSVNQIISYALLFVAIISLLIPYILNKKGKGAPDVKGYISKANFNIDKYVFSKTEFSDVTFDPNEKIELGEVIADGIYNGIINISSRNVVKGLYRGVGFTTAEMALFKVNNRSKSETYFVGKYIFMTNNLHFEGRYVLVRDNVDVSKKVDVPNALDDLVELYKEDGFTVYGPEGSDYTKVIPGSVIKSFKDMEINKYLLGNILVVWAGRSIFYTSYDDKVISLPFYEPLDTNAMSSFKHDLEVCVESLYNIWEKK